VIPPEYQLRPPTVLDGHCQPAYGAHMRTHRIAVADFPTTFRCAEDQSVLAAVAGAGLSAIQVGCRGGGCGVCRVAVISGEFETGCMSEAHVSAGDRARGIVLACQLFPRSDLQVRALGRRPGVTDDTAAAWFHKLAQRCAGALKEEQA
jgi:ferredoxin